MPKSEIPHLPGVLTVAQVTTTAASIAATQESTGAIPWFTGGHTDPWDHVECAMALTACGFHDAARAAYRWSAATQRPDGSWAPSFRDGRAEGDDTDVNFCAYLATGVWHYLCSTGDLRFAAELWPTVYAAIDFVVGLQRASGAIPWADGPNGPVAEALVTGCASMQHSIRCAVALADRLGFDSTAWDYAAIALADALRERPESFIPKDRYSMDWYYPVLGGVLRGEAGRRRIDERWDEFVVGDLGIRCVSDRPWVTGAETCELVLALDALGDHDRGRRLLAAMQHLREADGSYWTGLVFADGKRWPEERTSWTAAAMILATDALSRTTPGNGVFRDLAPTPLPVS